MNIPIVSRTYYQKNLQPYAETVYDFISKGFKVKRIDKMTLSIMANEEKYFLRRHGSDIKVFEQVIVNEEYRSLIDLLEKCGLANTLLSVLDCGSNIGLFSAWILNKARVKKIVSIEADLENYVFQKYVFSNMRYNSDVELVNKALWSDSESTLKISSDFRDGQQWAKSVVPALEIYPNTVKSISLNQVYDEYLDQEIHILKIDIEGAEKAVFENECGFDRLLANTKLIAIEI
ncbi:FkbM family methyltransferase, partial [Algoriphagus sp.]|uniref:FkbM family methyltransferase n=4 Tax=Algoriphagus sp. TaxID=1872435 RepID=UPI00329740EC